MLKPKKKLTKTEIKQDTLLTSYAKLTSYYDTYKKYINYGITGLIAVIIIIVVYVNNKKANDEKAATELGKIFSIYDRGTTDPRQYQIAIDGQPERGLTGLKTIVDNYGSTTSGEIARFYLAQAYLNLDKVDEALKNFNSFSSDNEILSASAEAGVAACYERKNEFDEAASYYEKAAKIASDQNTTPEYLNSAALCYGKIGNKEKAITILKRIKKEFPKSQVAREVDRYISQFSS
ncbi:MAG: tetratricopeptide repeat protein [Ignavibacteriales bacterium]|nr:tetratricopeptide repeat protein [Ignavibacteriales bacterium]